MPRPLRIWVPGVVYHLTARGNNRQAIFLDDLDYQQYLLALRQCRGEFSYRLLAFALMPNHVHLVFEAVEQVSLSTVMQRVSTVFAKYFNHRHQRVGHVYQGRFYSNMVDNEPYLLEVTRYVHLNPYRAGLSARPEMYPWSSYGSYVAGKPDPLGLVEPGPILSLFGPTAAEQTKRYREFVEQVLTDEHAVHNWLDRLHRQKIIPPVRWLNRVPGALCAL